MNGPQHYAKAERLLRAAEQAEDQGRFNASDRMVARAEVHATLATVAEAASRNLGGAVVVIRDQDWSNVLKAAAE